MNQQINLKRMGFLQLTGVTALLLTIGLWQLLGVNVLTMVVFEVGLVLLYSSSLIGIKYRASSSAICRDTTLLIVLEIVFLLFLYINSFNIRQKTGAGIFWIVTVGIIIIVILQILQLILSWQKIQVSHTAGKEIMLTGCLCLVIGFLLNIECFNTWPRNDNYAYFHLLSQLDAANLFLPNTDGLMVGSHLAPSYALWSLLFMSIPRISDINGLYLSNMMLIALDVILFYLLFKLLIPGKSITRYALYASIAAGAPWIFGMAAGISSELLMTTGILLLLYAVISDNPLLSVLSVFVLCGAREVGGMAAMIILLIQFLYDSTLSSRAKIKGKSPVFRWAYYIACYLLGFLWLIQLRGSRWMMQSRNTAPAYKIDGTLINHFGFSWIHIRGTLFGNFVWSFRWVFIGLIAAAIIVFFFQNDLKKRVISRVLHTKKEYCIIAAAFFVYVLELCLFVTWICPRYYTLSGSLLSIMGLCSFEYLLDRMCGEKIRITVTVLLAAMIWIQSYTTIDAVTLLACPYYLHTGHAMISAFPQHAEPYVIDPYLDSRAEYNRQILYYTKILDKAYAAIDDDAGLDHSRILCSNEYNGGINFHSLYTIWGYGYAYVDPKMYGHWNSEGRYRYLSYEQPTHTIDPDYVGVDADLNQYPEKCLYYIEMPWGDTVIEPLLKRYPSSYFYKTIEYRGWVLKIYKLKNLQ